MINLKKGISLKKKTKKKQAYTCRLEAKKIIK